MGINSFKTYPKWITLLKERAEERDLVFNADPANSKKRHSYYFKITSDTAAVMGKTHHSNHSGKRDGNHIETDYIDEIEQSAALERSSDEHQFEQVEILAVVINHGIEGEYDPETDDFLILDESALESIPPSGQKPFRDDSKGYPPPYNNHVNDWSRIFELFDDSFP